MDLLPFEIKGVSVEGVQQSSDIILNTNTSNTNTACTVSAKNRMKWNHLNETEIKKQ